MNESINRTISAGVVCAPTGIIFVCGGYHSPRTYECLDGWQCLLGDLTVPLTAHNQSETPHWSTPMNLHHQVRRDLRGGTHDSGFTSCGRFILPWLGVSTNEAMIRNLSLTLEDKTEYAAKAIAAPQISLTSW